MPKDRERYRYIDVGLERGSWTLAMFEEDARRHQMSDQPGKLITLRLTEYYEMKKTQEVISSRESLVTAGNDRLSRPTSSEASGGNGNVQRQEEDVLEFSQRAGENADEAAEYWVSL